MSTLKKESALDESKKLNLSAIIPEEIFSYAGNKYVVRLKPTYKLDAEGNQIPKTFTIPSAGIATDGWVMAAPEPELYKVEIKTVLAPKIVAAHGRPLTTRVDYVGPINASEVLKHEDMPLIYDNIEMQDKNLTVKNGKLVK